MPRAHLAWAVAAGLLVATPYVAAHLTPDAILLGAADLIIARMDEADAATADMEPEEDDDLVLEASMQAPLLCPDVQPMRRLRGGRT